MDGESDSVCVVRRDHDSDLLLVAVAPRLELGHPVHALGQALVVHGRGRVVVGVDGVLVAQVDGALPLLLEQNKKLSHETSVKRSAILNRQLLWLVEFQTCDMV